LQEVLTAARDNDPAVRLTAVQALVLFHESATALDALARALRDPEPSVRAAAAAGLTRLGPFAEAALPALLTCLREDDLHLQGQALTAILVIGKPGDALLLAQLGEFNVRGRWADPPDKPGK